MDFLSLLLAYLLWRHFFVYLTPLVLSPTQDQISIRYYFGDHMTASQILDFCLMTLVVSVTRRFAYILSPILGVPFVTLLVLWLLRFFYTVYDGPLLLNVLESHRQWFRQAEQSVVIYSLFYVSTIYATASGLHLVTRYMLHIPLPFSLDLDSAA